MIDRILTLVLSNWEWLQLDVPKPRNFKYVLQSRHKVMFFLFDVDSRSRIPLAVVKIARQEEDGAELKNAVDKVKAVRDLLPAGLCETVPRILLLGTINGLTCTMETIVPGEPMAVASRGQHRVIGQNLRAFSEWLIKFQKFVQTDASRLGSSVGDAIAVLSSQLPESHGCRSLAALLDIGKRTEEMTIPLVWRFGDAHPSNILLQEGSVSGVVDWDGAAPHQWPILDWFQFVLSYALEHSKKLDPSRNLTDRACAALDMIIGSPSTTTATVFQDETKRFISTYGLAPELFPAMFAIFLAQLWWPGDKSPLYRHLLSLLSAQFP